MRLQLHFEYSEEEKKKLNELRKLVESCPELDIGTDDVFLGKFLSAAEWNPQHALQRIHTYYDFKYTYPNWIAIRLPSDLRAIMELRIKYILPYPDKQGRTIYVNKLVDAFDRFPNYLFDMIEFDDLLFEAALSMPNTQRNGIVAIIDMKGLNRSFFKVLNPKHIRVVNKKNDALPFKETHFHIVNTSIFLSAALSMVMPFLGKKLKDKMYFHGNNYQKLQEHLGYECLPHEYGGPKENVLDPNRLYDFMWEREHYYKQLMTYKKIPK